MKDKTMTVNQTIGEDEWIETHRPVPSPSADGGFDFGSGPTLLDWTKADDAAVIDAADPKCIWTVVEGDDGMAIVAGLHRVNRIGHILTEIPSPYDDLEVVLDE